MKKQPFTDPRIEEITKPLRRTIEIAKLRADIRRIEDNLAKKQFFVTPNMSLEESRAYLQALKQQKETQLSKLLRHHE